MGFFIPAALIVGSMITDQIAKNQERQAWKGYRPPDELSRDQTQELRTQVSDITAPQYSGAFARERADISRISAASSSRGLGRTGVPVSAVAERVGATGGEIGDIQGRGNQLYAQMYQDKLNKVLQGYNTKFMGKMQNIKETGESLSGGMRTMGLMSMLMDGGTEKKLGTDSAKNLITDFDYGHSLPTSSFQSSPESYDMWRRTLPSSDSTAGLYTAPNFDRLRLIG